MALLRRLCGSVGDGAVIRPIFSCDYGYNIRLGRNAFINFNCVFLDCAPIDIGDNLQMGPAVQFYTAAHPLETDVRRSGLEYARPIRIGNDVWIGGGAIILPGVISAMVASSAQAALWCMTSRQPRSLRVIQRASFAPWMVARIWRCERNLERIAIMQFLSGG